MTNEEMMIILERALLIPVKESDAAYILAIVEERLRNNSLIKKALVFKTDEERMEWFQSLAPEEQAEVAKEAKEVVDNVIEVFLPAAEALAKVFVMWLDLLYENLEEVYNAFAFAQANNAWCGQETGGTASDGDYNPSVSCH